MPDIAGFKDTTSFSHLSGQSILRWWSADWFQPIAKIGRTGSDAWPLISADGDTAVQIGKDAFGNEVPEHFYDDASYKDRLAELSQGPAENDPRRLPYDQKIPAAELARANEIASKSKLRKTFVSNFTALADGELILYVNDAIAAVPFFNTIEGFYRNNSGSAKVTVKLLSAAPPS
jgi:hypothetical protein